MTTFTMVRCDRCQHEEHANMTLVFRIVAGANSYHTDLCKRCYQELCEFFNFKPDHPARVK